ncbi:MAG: electron transport complex, RnfABCDGE type, subunit [Candidatus Aminicenantes bacterium]|nr:electron transport complex, RnfABCDGE type, subunit [Candidatus Aminicenantes bacterium]
MKRRTFRRGIHPPERKATAGRPVERLPAPEKAFVPFLQHFGKPAIPLVKAGERVFLGQKIGEAAGTFSSPVHSPVSGKVLALDLHPFPSGTPVLTAAIENDGLDTRAGDPEKPADPFILSSETILQKVREAGVVGMGGASFPTAVKLAPPPGKPVDTIIINGCECEPVQTGDHRLMLESPEEILKGAELIRLAARAGRIVFGLEENKRDALESLRGSVDGRAVELVLLRTKYPQGAEKMLIQALLGREVPRGGLPFDVGVVVQNVATAKAVWEAVSEGRPLTERVLTCGGPGIADPKNLSVRIGTPIRQVIEFCGGLKEGAGLVVYGGPMMGLAQSSLDSPVIKSTTGVLAFPEGRPEAERACIRCARCVDHCPMGLMPTRLARLARFAVFEEAEKWGTMDCIECGCCQYICPSRIPLLSWIRLGKNRIAARKSGKGAA